MIGFGSVRIFRPARSSGDFTAFLASTLREPKLYAQATMRIFAPLEQRVLDRLRGAGVERLGLLRETVEQVAEVERADERHEVGRDRRTGDHHVDDAELHRIDDVDLLAELVVREERELDLLAEIRGFHVLRRLSK